MAIALDAAVGSKNQVSPGAITWSFTHTVTPGTDRFLFVHIFFIPDAAQTISSVTYGGVALTVVDTATVDDGTSFTGAALYRLIAPASGSNTVVITFSAKTAGGAFSTSWSGVHQTAPLGTAAKATGTTAAITVDVTSASGEVVVDAMGQNTVGNPVVTVGANQTAMGVNQIGKTANGASYEAGAATTTMSWASDTSGPWAIVAVPLKPATAATATFDADTRIAELRVVNLRTAPDFSQGANAAIVKEENNQAAWEASGLVSKVLVGRQQGDEIVWDDLWTLSALGPAGKLAVTGLPAANSPDNSLLVATQDAVFQYPLPYGLDPSITDYPRYPQGIALSQDDPADFLSIYYPSAVDLGGEYALVYVEVFGQDMVSETDDIGFSFRWDETNPWEAARFITQSYGLLQYSGENHGRVLHAALSVQDGDQSDVIGPSVRAVVAWVRPVDVRATQPARTSPEVS